MGVWNRVKYAVGEFLIYQPLKNSLGLSRVRVGYTAGEAIGPEIFEFYRSLGINLKQLYGQTEAGVFVTLQPDGEVRADTVGIACPGVELKIGETGEVFIDLIARLSLITKILREQRKQKIKMDGLPREMPVS